MDNLNNEPMIKFRDREGNKITVARENIVLFIEASPFAKPMPQNPLGGQHLIVMKGIQSVVSLDTLYNVMKQCGESPIGEVN